MLNMAGNSVNERENMFGILAFMAMAFGVSLMLPDGADDGGVHNETNPDAVDPTLELGGSGDLLSEIDISDYEPDFLDDEVAVEISDELNLETSPLSHGDVAIENVNNNQVGTSSSPYENDFDLSAFEMIEFAGGSDSDIIGTDRGDLLVGGRGSDVVTGGAGDDYIFGGTGSDILVGGEGSDLIVACANPAVGDEADASELYGGEGDDTLIGENDDRFVGGDGIDFFNVFSDDQSSGQVAHISDFDASSESILIEVRDGQMGGELDFDVQKTETGVDVLVNGISVVFLEGVDQTTGLNIVARSVGY